MAWLCQAFLFSKISRLLRIFIHYKIKILKFFKARESSKTLVYNIIINKNLQPLKKENKLRNSYKSSMMYFVKVQPSQIASGQELVRVYNEVADKVNPEISRSHIPLNVHAFAKKYGQIIGSFRTENGQISTIYQFNF